MTDQRCNATLNGMKCGKYGHPDGTLHRHKHEPAADRGCYAAWTDGFPGAKPHAEPVTACGPYCGCNNKGQTDD